MIRSLHHDWPAVDLADRGYNMGDPYSDIYYALDEARFEEARAFGSKSERIALSDIREIVRYDIKSHGESWDGTNGIGTELDMYMVGQLLDGRWFSLVGYNDYTGWGCQSGADVKIGDTEDQVVQYGLDQAGRKILGYEG